MTRCRAGLGAAALLALATLTGPLPTAASGGILPAGGAPLAGSEWKPVGIAGTAMPDDTQIFLQFRGKGRLQGHGGCNRFAGGYTATDGNLSIGPLGVTRRLCGPSLDRTERRLLAALERAKGYRRAHIRLTLLDAAGQPVMQLRQTDAD